MSKTVANFKKQSGAEQVNDLKNEADSKLQKALEITDTKSKSDIPALPSVAHKRLQQILGCIKLPVQSAADTAVIPASSNKKLSNEELCYLSAVELLQCNYSATGSLI